MKKHFFLFLLLCFVLGCSPANEFKPNFPETAPCLVKILDGTKPLANCTVTFHSSGAIGFAVIAHE
ncbi:MAG: hypothetical protein LBT05_10915 [Planctomycetaceae bacterium]|jgi:hypothetical protein|nr:hypothetical protein [Planctomycetaceae bacterium]